MDIPQPSSGRTIRTELDLEPVYIQILDGHSTPKALRQARSSCRRNVMRTAPSSPLRSCADRWTEHCNRPCLFSNDQSGILVSSQADNLDMTYVVHVRPFKELEICNELGFHPNALRHLWCSQSLTPSAALRFRQIRERASLYDERF
jgi:hypothetical protein